jgi:transcriptional regulator with XRE-family HTH domain
MGGRAVTPTPVEATEGSTFGELLRAWRTARGTSQLALSVRTEVSARHLSCLETGRAQPSREMVLHLAKTFDMPLRDCNAFLHAAGFAPMYRETPLDAREMGPVRDAIDLLLRSTEPNPTFVINRRADILECNDAGRWILRTFNEDIGSFARPYNIGKLLVCEKGERAYIENWADVTRRALARLKRDLGGVHARTPADEDLLKTIAATQAELGEPPVTEPLSVLYPVRFRRGDIAVNLFTTLATLGTPIDVTLQELRIEMFFPADEPSKRVLEARPEA